MDDALIDRILIREQVERWVIWRDSGCWEKFRTVWHDGARMNTTWYSGPVDDFIAHARRTFERCAIAAHFLGGTAIELSDRRAIAQTKKRIESRQLVEGVLCDLVCIGRFYQFFEKRFAYVQTRAGMPVKRDLPGQRGAAVERLYAAGAAFLEGAPAVF